MGIASSILNAYPQTYEEYVDKVIVGEDGINSSTGKDREYYLQHEPTRARYEKQLKQRQGQAYASELQGDGNAFYNATTGFGNAVAEIPAFFGSLVPNDLPGEALDDVFTFQNIYNKLKGEYRIDKEFAQKELGRDLTEKDLEAIQNYIEDKGIAPNIGYSAGFASDILLGSKGIGSAKGVGTKIGSKAGDVASDLKYGDIGFTATRGKLPEATSLGAAAARESATTKQIDFTKSLDENVEQLKPLIGTKLGDSNKSFTKDSLSRIIKRQLTLKNQDSVQGYKSTYKNMLEDKSYMPPVDYFNPLKLKVPEGSVKKTVTTRTPNQTQAITELAKELNISRTEIQNLITGANEKRKKIKALQSAIEAGPEALAKFNQTRYGSAKIRRRENLAGSMSSTRYETEIKNAMNQKRSLENLEIKNNKLFANKNVFNNPRFMSQLSTYVDPKTGSIIQLDPTKNLKNLIKANKFWQIDHIYGLEHKSKVGGMPSNLQLIPGILNTNFKRNAETFITKNLNNPEAKEIITYLIAKSKELRITLRPKGIEARLGYKQPAIQQGQSLTKFDDQLDFYYGDVQRKSFAVGDFTGESKRKKIFSLDPDVMKDRFVSSGVRSNDPYALAAEQDAFEIRQEIIDLQEVQKQTKEFLSSKKPLKFKFSELLNPKKMADNPLIRKGINANFYGGGVYLMEVAETIANGFKTDQGEPDRLQFEQYFPFMHKAYEQMTAPLPETPDEQTYISAIDELNKGMERGLVNLSYDIFDLATMGLDLSSSVVGKDTAFQQKLKESFDKMDKSEPETFLGKITTVATEFGVPGGTAYKLVNRFRKLLGGAFGANLFAESTLGLKGSAYYGTAITNLSKAVGTNAVAFGLTDFVAGGPSNSLTEYFGPDPLLLTDLEETKDLTGSDLALANFRNRLRFGADGAMIGGMFPLVGSAFKEIVKPAVSKIGAPLVGAAATVADELAIKPISYLAAGKLKSPFSAPGKFEVDVPIAGKALSYVGKAPLVFGEFLGKDIISRIGATAFAPEFLGKGFATSLTGSTKGGGKQFKKAMKETFTGRLPDYKDWRLFEVTSDNALEVGLKRFDNFLGYFRDSARQSSDRFRITGETDKYIKARSAEVEDYLKMIEVRAHDLATGFLKRSNTNTTSPAGEQAMLEQVLNYLKGNIKITQLDEALQEPAKQLGRVLDDIKVSFKDILPDDNDLKTLLNSDLKSYYRQSFAVFNNPKYNIIEAALEDTTKVGKRVVGSQEKEIYENALNFIVKQIQKNESVLETAKTNPGGIKNQAKQHLKEIMMKTRIEGRDPLEIMSNIARENLFLDDLVIRTGDELPEAIKKFLGRQEGLRDSVVTTTASLLTQSSNMRMYKRMLDDGLENNWIFKTREEARAAGVLNPQRIASKTDGRMSGITGELNPEITKYFASPDIAHSIGQSQGGMFDSLYQNFVVQNLIAYKAGVQTMKTVFSPATQARNFGSAMFFPLNMGHIGGNASVTDAFKIVMDDIFGAGRTANEEQMIRYLSRQKELGVIDENIVVSELQAVLQDIKSGQLKTVGGMAERINNSELVKGATKLYAGGDNVWKLYGHEFVKSQLKDVGFKNVAEVGDYMKKMFGVSVDEVSTMTNKVKTVREAIEEAAAYTIRETYPTYSKVPDLVKFFRRMPFVGNFVSFPAEILRTSVATTGYALKHIADDNPMLRQMGYRTLMGQATAVGGAGAVFAGLGHAYTGITEGQVRNYQKNFAPDFMKYSQLMPIAKIPRKNSKGEIITKKVKDESGSFVYDENGDIVREPLYVDGQFKVFDLSRYLPYDLVSSTARSLLNAYSGPNRETLDPSMVDDLVLKSFFNTAGPLYDLAGGTFFGTAIGFEPLLPLITKGKDKNGRQIWGKNDSLSIKTDKFMAHWFNTVEPGGFSSAQKVFNALQGDVQKGSGVPLVLKDELFKLFGGSTVTVDMQSALRYKIADFKDTFPASRATENYFSTQDFMNRGPEWLIASYNQQNREAFAEQYEFYRAVRAAQGKNNLPEKRLEAQRISNLPDEDREDRFKGKSKGRIFVILQKDDAILKDDEIQQVLTKRLGNKRAASIMAGLFTPLSTGEEGLNTRRLEIYRNNPQVEKDFNYEYFMPIGELETLKAEWSVKTFEEYEKAYMEEKQKRLDARKNNQSSLAPTPETSVPETPVAPLPTTAPAQAAPVQTAAANPITGLTTTETALLDRDEQLIRQRQRGTV